MHGLLSAIITLILLTVISPPLQAEEYQSFYPALQPVEQTRAFEQYLLRPYSEHSKILYLIDRFGSEDVKIIYDGYEFNSQFASHLALWFLSRFYKNENPKTWILRWCNRSFPGGNLIMVKLPDGKLVKSRDMLLMEMVGLEEAQQKFMEKKIQKKSESKSQRTPTKLTVAGLSQVLSVPQSTAY